MAVEIDPRAIQNYFRTQPDLDRRLQWISDLSNRLGSVRRHDANKRPLAAGLLALTVCALTMRPLCAGTITLDTQVDATPRPDMLHIAIHISDHGDEAAYHLQFKVELPEGGTASPTFPKLDVGENRAVSLQAPIKGALRGRYPLLIRTLYSDANQYTFSALAASSYVVGEDATPGVLPLLGHATIERSGRIRLRLKNLDGIRKKMTVHLFLPQEISSSKTALEILLSAGQETEASFSIRNFSALNNSRYAVFAVVEYDQNGLHYTATSPGTIEIRPGAYLEQYRRYLLPAFGIILILFIAFHLYATWRRQSAPPRKTP